MNHVLTALDSALQAFFAAAAIPGLDATQIVRNKESVDKELPVLICSSENAERKRARNWLVSGLVLLKSDPTTDANEDNQVATTTMEAAVLERLESFVPADDRPQALADAITAAGVANSVVAANEFAVTAFTIKSVSAGFDDDAIWTFSVDFTATVIA